MQFKVPLSVVQYWLGRAGPGPLDAVDWADQSHAPHQPPGQTEPLIERRVLAVRQTLGQGALGFIGADAIADALRAELGVRLPSVRTIGRILRRHGVLDAQRRVRRIAPPPGWYLPPSPGELGELDAFDVVEDLRLEGGPLVDVLTACALLGSVVGAWPRAGISAAFTMDCLLAHWRAHGLPRYAQFDNDTRFQGPHQHPDTLGRVGRLCLALGVVPVFAPPGEQGFQNTAESFNNLWQEKVWLRFHHESLLALRARSDRFVAALAVRWAKKIERSPARRRFPRSWRLDLQARPRGTILYVRRTDEAGAVRVLGHRWVVQRPWCHRLVRAEVDLDQDQIRFYTLRRREPTEQPLVKTVHYRFPHRPFRAD
ncbi:MAG: hypothetical protein HYY24_08495 [Verrucomicrobia bacterium]|nr:hypothetical protein [Verrucomicrobiota bacterium]